MSDGSLSGAVNMVDVLSPNQRSYCMSRIKGKDTGIEKAVRSALHIKGYRFKKHVRDLPGRPDLVFPKHRLVVFIDGDFWHGYRFSAWREKLPDFWRDKIGKNIERDRRNFRKLRTLGWKVVRIWEHQVERDFTAQLGRILAFLPSK